MSTKVAVIILTVDQCARTLACLSALHACEDPVGFDVLLWDNGSRDGTAETVTRRFPRVLAHRHPSNLGVASGRNAAAKLAVEKLGASHLLFLDNDMIVTSGFVRALLQPFELDERLGQTQAKLRFLKDRERLNDGGGCRIRFWLGQTRPVGYGELDRGQYDRRAECVACGGAMMVRAEVFFELEGFDPLFDPFGPEDLDFSLRLQRAGYRALYVPEAMAYHEVSHTFEGGEYSERYARYKARHWLQFMRRHASPVEQVGFFLVGSPYIALRVLIREGRRGKLGGLKGLFRGAVESWRSGSRAKD